MEKQKVALEALFPTIQETLANGGTVKLPVTGTSMRPLLREGRDSVTLVKAEGPLQKYDLPFYRRENGIFVLHRVIAVQKDGYVMCGDHQCSRECGIQDSQIIGLVTAISRKGKTFSVSSPRYRAFVKLWCGILPIRKVWIYTKAGFRKLKGLL